MKILFARKTALPTILLMGFFLAAITIGCASDRKLQSSNKEQNQALEKAKASKKKKLTLDGSRTGQNDWDSMAYPGESPRPRVKRRSSHSTVLKGGSSSAPPGVPASQ